MNEKYKKTCKYLNYVEHLLVLASSIIGCVSISTFVSLVCILLDIASYSGGVKSLQELKQYKSSIEKKNKRCDKKVMLGKYKFNTYEVLISNVLIESFITHHEFVSVN